MVYSSMKRRLRRVTFVRILYRRIKPLEAISPFSHMIEQNRIVILKPCFQMKGFETGHMILHETVKDYLEHCGVLRVRKTRADRLAIPQGAILLYRPLALLRIPLSHEEYLKKVGAKTRNMIRKAEKQGYKFQEFDWNNYLDEIFDINTSKEVRSAGPMHGWYVKPVKPQHHSEKEQRYWKYYGVFKGDRLWAYSNLVLSGDFAFFKHFIGHGDHLTNGIMNYLLSCIVQEYVGHSNIKWLNYGSMSLDGSNGDSAFKKHAGFKSYVTFLDLENDQMLLKYSRRMWVGDF